MYGYGSYGASIDADFSFSRLSLLDRGFVYAIVHVRGGGELGQQWYEDGKFLKKKNTFNDYLDACDALLKLGYGSPSLCYANQFLLPPANLKSGGIRRIRNITSI